MYEKQETVQTNGRMLCKKERESIDVGEQKTGIVEESHDE